MDTSLFIQQKNTGRRWIEAAYIAAAVFLAGTCFAVLTGQLRLMWRLPDAFSGGLVSGLVSAWNHARDTFGITGFVLLRKFAGEDRGYGLFLTIVLVLMILLAWLCVRSRTVPMLLIFIVPPVFLSLLFGLSADTRVIILFAAALFVALIVMRMDGAGAQAFVTAALLVGLMAAIFAGARATRLQIAGGNDGSGTSFSKTLADRIYGTDPLGHGDLTRTSRIIDEGNALEVTMSEPQEMYLRGFIGSRYYGNRWRSLDNSVYYQAEDVMEALRDANFNAPGQLAQAAELSEGSAESNEVTVKNTGADSRFAFVPYEITKKGSLENRLTRGGGEFYRGILGRFRTVSYTASENQTSGWTDVAGSLFTSALGSGDAEEIPDDEYDAEYDEESDDEYDEESDEDGTEEWEEEEEAEEAETIDEEQAAKIAEYLRLESHYNDFVYQNDTYISARDRKLLAGTIGTAGDQSKGHIDYKVAINAVREYLDSNFVYSDNLGTEAEAPEDANALQTFFETHRGYDIHFATAATLMFRYYGIPARYVEGYLITESDAEGADEEGTVAVSRERAHAWTEIYIDGIGFVPLEVTPSFYGVMSEADLNVGISNESLMNTFRDAYGNTGSREEPDEEDTDLIENERAGAILHVLKLLLLILLLAAAAAGLFFLLRFLLRLLLAYRTRRRMFYKEEPKTAVAAIYGYMEEKQYPLHSYTVMLGNRAAYSQDTISEEERGTMLRLLEKAKKAKKEERHLEKKTDGKVDEKTDRKEYRKKKLKAEEKKEPKAEKKKEPKAEEKKEPKTEKKAGWKIKRKRAQKKKSNHNRKGGMRYE